MSDFARLRFLYRLILAIDANFRLKSKQKNSKEVTPLTNGLAYSVQKKDFEEFLNIAPDIHEASVHDST